MNNEYQEQLAIDEKNLPCQVECLGMIFQNNEERRQYYLGKLALKLNALKGRDFPVSLTDEYILALSDPPYYTACPNLFINDYIAMFSKPYDRNIDTYNCEPYAFDISEGKNDPIYSAHSYHTKVPYKAIMRYILHYTEPGDLVFDGFCGTGMTGIAAQLCGEKSVVESLGYKVNSDGLILNPVKNETGQVIWKKFSKIGVRHVLLNDLSPAATFIAYNFNKGISSDRLNESLKNLTHELHKVENDLWTIGINEYKNASISYVVWSDIFICENCSEEIVFWNSAVDHKTGKVSSEIECQSCSSTFSKRQLRRPFITVSKSNVSELAKLPKLEPVLIGIVPDGKRSIIELPVDHNLRKTIIKKHIMRDFPSDFPDYTLQRSWEMYRHGMGKHEVDTHWQLYIPGTAATLNVLWKYIQNVSDFDVRHKLMWIFTSIVFRSSKFNRRLPSGGGAPITGVLYIPSMIRQENPIKLFLRNAVSLEQNVLSALPSFSEGFCIQTGDLGALNVPDNSLDYAFIDPPFGSNIFYADMNFLWESWLRVVTNRTKEAIISDRALNDRKTVSDYGSLMLSSFLSVYQALKPGRWLTVEFHNSSNIVWNVISEALQMAGFVVADVRTLDKKQRSFRQTTAAGAVKQDLIISAYKPDSKLERRFKQTSGSEEGVWDFIRNHLKQLPVFISKDGQAEAIAERQNYLLYDRMVAFHVQRGVTVPLSAMDFYAGLVQRFSERDGMFFLPEQIAEYDKKRMNVREVLQLNLFVTDESSAIQWLKQQLIKRPQTFQELHPYFLREIGGWQKHEKPLELYEILEQNFLRYDGKDEVPSQIHSYLSTNFKEMRNLPNLA
jgi:DNA modification methylase